MNEYITDLFSLKAYHQENQQFQIISNGNSEYET
jgi:hypothetical protein